MDLNKIQPKPKNMKTHCFDQTWHILAPINDCWTILNSMETFTKGQVFPYKVEFLAEDIQSPSFSTGVWTNHHGPLLNVCGRIGKIVKHSYRDLNYCYGSYIVSFRLIRPVRLQFLFDHKAPYTTVTLKLECYVHQLIYPVWSMIKNIFWKSFKWSISKKIIKSKSND